MSDSPLDFDLKFLPDWLKETPAPNRYADFEGESGDRPRRERDDRRGAPRGQRPPDRRGPGPRPPQGDRPRGPRSDRPPGNRPGGGGDRRGDKRPFDRDRRREEAPRPAPVPAPAEVRVEFLPEPNAAAGISRQIKTSSRAYAVFSTAKLFLERPERHRVRLTSSNPEVPLFQIGDGPVSFDRAAIERGAFQQARAEYYAEETVQGEPIKGNFSNIARCRSTGTLLGPTNHHGYQPALRKLYEERFSRRMSFQEFQQQEIETVASEQAVADWKEQARTSTTYRTTQEAEPIIFKTAFDAEQHFRKTYLSQLVKSGITLECDGPASRVALDRHIGNTVRQAWEQERVFPQGVVNGLRRYFGEAGLHYFKHRKRILHVSGIKPLRHASDQTFSDSITGILRAVEAQPRIKRPDLAKRLLGAHHDAPEAVERKAQLAADVHYLVHMGHLIEFADASFDLPLGPKGEQPPPEKGAAPAVTAAAVPQTAVDEPAEDTASGEPEDGEAFATESVLVAEEAPGVVEDTASEVASVAKPASASEQLPTISELTAEAESPAATESFPHDFSAVPDSVTTAFVAKPPPAAEPLLTEPAPAPHAAAESATV